MVMVSPLQLLGNILNTLCMTPDPINLPRNPIITYGSSNVLDRDKAAHAFPLIIMGRLLNQIS